MWTSFCLICPSAGDVPQSLPSFLVARCGDPASWIYSDQKCDGTNNCGDCSDELSPGGGLGTDGAGAGAQAMGRGQRLTTASLRSPPSPPGILGSFPPLLGCLQWWGAHYHTKWLLLEVSSLVGNLLSRTQMRKRGLRVIMQGVCMWPSWDLNFSFPHFLCSSPQPCEESRAGITGLIYM